MAEVKPTSNDEWRALMREALQAERTAVIAEVAEAVFIKIEMHLELLGLSAEDAEGREAKRKDHEMTRRVRLERWEEDIKFARTLRLRFEAAANAIVKSLLVLGFAGFLALVAWGGALKINR